MSTRNNRSRCRSWNTSFGVVPLEMLMGKYPEDIVSLMLSSGAPSTPEPLMLSEILDPRLPPPRSTHLRKDIVLVATAALECQYEFLAVHEQVSQNILRGKVSMVKTFNEISVSDMHQAGIFGYEISVDGCQWFLSCVDHTQ